MKPAHTPTLLGSTGRDVFVFVLILVLIIYTLPRLKVYYSATPCKVTLEKVTADGVATPMSLPEGLEGVDRRKNILKKIQIFSGSSEAARITPPGGRLEWTLKYSKNSLRYDQEKKIITTATPANLEK